MPNADWQKVRDIFASAMRRQPEERRRFVLHACGDDKTLLAEVESLLSSLGSAESFMETPAIAEFADVIKTETKKLEAGKCFGHYEIIEQIGAGGPARRRLARFRGGTFCFRVTVSRHPHNAAYKPGYPRRLDSISPRSI